jgi:hypothetical protein
VASATLLLSGVPQVEAKVILEQPALKKVRPLRALPRHSRSIDRSRGGVPSSLPSPLPLRGAADARSSPSFSTQPTTPPTNPQPTNQEQVLQSDGSAPAAKPAAGKPAAAKKQQKVAETSGGGLSAQAIALPGALALIGAGTVAISKLDDGFFDFMEATSAKDSGLDGAGYETALKAEGGFSGARAGTKKVKAKAGGAAGGLGGLFGKK